MCGISLQITNILYFSLFTLEFLSVIFIEIGSNTNFLPRIWESSGVSEVKVWVCFDILFLLCAISFSPSSFSQNSLFLSFVKLLGYMYVLFLFVNYVLLLENNFNLNPQKVLFFFSEKFSFIISLMSAYFQCHMVSFQCIAYVYMCLHFIASIFSIFLFLCSSSLH